MLAPCPSRVTTYISSGTVSFAVQNCTLCHLSFNPNDTLTLSDSAAFLSFLSFRTREKWRFDNAAGRMDFIIYSVVCVEKKTIHKRRQGKKKPYGRSVLRDGLPFIYLFIFALLDTVFLYPTTQRGFSFYGTWLLLWYRASSIALYTIIFRGRWCKGQNVIYFILLCQGFVISVYVVVCSPHNDCRRDTVYERWRWWRGNRKYLIDFFMTLKLEIDHDKQISYRL